MCKKVVDVIADVPQEIGDINVAETAHFFGQHVIAETARFWNEPHLIPD